jgi:hypothetical protein
MRARASDCGVLLEKPVCVKADGATTTVTNRLRAVKVVNSTPEPDGSRKEYLRQVPWHCNTAREAVAWTFGLAAKEYRPETWATPSAVQNARCSSRPGVRVFTKPVFVQRESLLRRRR